MNFITDLENSFIKVSNAENAKPMEDYMKNNFPFFGIKTKDRRLIFKELIKKHQAEISANSRLIAEKLFEKKERELHYCGIEIHIKFLKNKYQIDDILWIEKWIITHAWWDSVDTISKFILGEYLAEFPEQIPDVVQRFSNSNSLWLNRSTLLFQLGYKEKTDFELLKKLCLKFSNSNEFFIKKAIGWALREYAKSNPSDVFEFVHQADLKPLSEKEALKNIKL